MESTVNTKIYVTIKNHLFARLAMTGDDPRVLTVIEDKNGSKSDYVLFNRLEGMISRIYYTKTPNGHDILNIDLIGIDGDKRTLQMLFFMRGCTDFLQRMENIRFSEPVVVRIGKSEKDGFTNEFLWIEQGDYRPTMKYTLADKQDRPMWERDSDGKWDRTKEYEWWKGKIQSVTAAVEVLGGGAMS